MKLLDYIIADIDQRGPFFWLLVGVLACGPWTLP
jgi:hypothetical protein